MSVKCWRAAAIEAMRIRRIEAAAAKRLCDVLRFGNDSAALAALEAELDAAESVVVSLRRALRMHDHVQPWRERRVEHWG